MLRNDPVTHAARRPGFCRMKKCCFRAVTVLSPLLCPPQGSLSMLGSIQIPHGNQSWSSSQQELEGSPLGVWEESTCCPVCASGGLFLPWVSVGAKPGRAVAWCAWAAGGQGRLWLPYHAHAVPRGFQLTSSQSMKSSKASHPAPTSVRENSTLLSARQQF